MTIFVLMNKSCLIISCVCLLLSAALSGRAQDYPVELQTFQDAAGERSILFRGKQAPKYNFSANGHPYWVQFDFERGDIIFEGQPYHDMLINVDALAQLALVRVNDSPFAVGLAPSQTPSFTMGGRRFVGIGPGEALPEGFYEVFGNGPERVYKHVYKRIESSTGNANGDTIGYYDPNYRENITRHFTYKKIYYFRDAQGNFSRFRSRNALISKFPDRRKEIRQAISAARLNEYGSSFDAFCEAVLNYAAR